MPGQSCDESNTCLFCNLNFYTTQKDSFHWCKILPYESNNHIFDGNLTKWFACKKNHEKIENRQWIVKLRFTYNIILFDFCFWYWNSCLYFFVFLVKKYSHFLQNFSGLRRENELTAICKVKAADTALLNYSWVFFLYFSSKPYKHGASNLYKWLKKKNLLNLREC